MAHPRFDPTSVAARRFQAEKKKAHRIRLKKQLERAHRKLEAATTPSPTLHPSIEETLSHLGESSTRPRATSGPHKKPNPVQRALKRREELVQEAAEVAAEREREQAERRDTRARQHASRERIRKKLTQTTKKGQPRLGKHIDVLLAKIQKEK